MGFSRYIRDAGRRRVSPSIRVEEEEEGGGKKDQNPTPPHFDRISNPLKRRLRAQIMPPEFPLEPINLPFFFISFPPASVI